MRKKIRRFYSQVSYYIYCYNILIFEILIDIFSLPDHEVVWKHVEWVLNKDQLAGVKVCLCKSHTS